MGLCAAGGRLLVHVPVGEAADNKKREPRASKRPTASPGSLVSGTVLHVLADHATVQLDNGENQIHGPSYPLKRRIAGVCASYTALCGNASCCVSVLMLPATMNQGSAWR